ncbi:hypothetical protein D9757_000332 [Collybiopsis confluens]|uniref:protein-tyrosine-phosphatase n=1 Tax=Collybiopsis confluens TaxID=2823264 RepID=A0A8H5I3J6_9AGAR|nr:hypothetical protein D9757_000332 [Collybiopsis confluens]
MESGDEPLWTLKPPLQDSASPLDQEPIEFQKLRKWQQERVAKKLRGDYESLRLHLADLVNDSLLSPMRIASMRVEGAHKTRPSFLSFLINPIASPSSGDAPQDVQSVLHAARQVSDRLQRADIFHSVSVRIERSRDELAPPEGVDLVFSTREKGRFYLKTSTELGNNEGSASAIARIRNVFGGAETFEANMSLGTTTRKSFNGSLSLPIMPDLNTSAEIGAFGLSKDYSSFASCSETLRGVRALVRHGEPLTGSHEFAYQAVLRNIGSLVPTASISVREAAGQTSKSSLSYTYTFDNRDDHITGTRGFHTKVFQEYAGLGGDASYFKAETEHHLSRPIVSGATLSLSASSGFLWSFASPSLLPDRFQLGGPLSVRSMRFAGLGPRDGSDSLGGDLFWSTGLSVISNIPKRGNWPLKSHVFLNAGRLDALDRSRTFAENINSTLSKPSISAGVGLIYKFDPIRLEVNFGLPLVASKSDGTRKGIQLWINLNMRNSFSTLDESDSDLEQFSVSTMVPKCEPLCCFSDRLYFTTFPHPAPNPGTLNRLAADSNYCPRVRPRPRGFPATTPDEDASYYYFTVDDQLLYLSFFQDWGPLNIAMVYKACILVHELLEDKDLAAHRLVLYSSSDPRRKANAALLMALYVMIVQRRAPWEAFHPIAETEFMPFRDAGRGPSDFNLNIQDCLWGIWKAMQNGLCDMNEFDIEDYEFYEKVENGDWNWITPNFIAFASPVDQNWIKRQKDKDDSGSPAALASSTNNSLALQGKLPTPFLNCLDYFEKRNIKMVVRLNNQLYDRGTFLDRGIDHMELYFDDGTNPTDEIVRTFLDVADRIIEDGGVVAVHCKAGLGRTASLIGAYLIWKYGFTASEAIAFMRIVRPGSVVGPQQQYLYLKQLEWSKWAAIDEARKIQAAAVVPSPAPAVITPATPPADTDEETPLRPSTPEASGSALPLPPVTPSRHVAAAAAAAKEIAPPGQPRKTPKGKRSAPAHDSDD